MSTSAAKPSLQVAPRSAHWVLAAVLATGMHLAVAGAVLLHSPEPEDAGEVAGSQAVEVAPTFTTSARDVEVAVGVASSEQQEVEAKVASSEVPLEPEPSIVPPTRTENDPDLAFRHVEAATPATLEQKERLDHQPSEQNVAAASASLATAPLKTDAALADKSTAPSFGVSPTAVRAKTTWNRMIAAHLERYKRYPSSAGTRGIAGKTVVAFQVARDGAVSDPRIVASSGNASLDAAALDMVVRASPVPAVPKDVAGVTFSLAVPVAFVDR